nr:hypothetical protein [uncultured Schaedlerella sp.]
MKERRKAWIQLITGIIILLCMFCTPEFAVLVFIGLVVFYIGKRLWHVPIGTIKRKRK